jgi:hypothetical protein
MTTKEAKPVATEPDYVMKPEERGPAERIFAKMIAKRSIEAAEQ